jgi:hypothetical protein
MLPLAPLLSQRTISQVLLKHLAKLQVRFASYGEGRISVAKSFVCCALSHSYSCRTSWASRMHCCV